MNRYKTVLKKASAEQVIEKSKFIAHVSPVLDREEAERFIEEIKSENKDATHNVPAMVIGEGFQIQWASDDGEPRGTAGAPMVQMLVKEGITNVAVVVTRIFGGIKLGTGGLVRAYTGSAKLGLEAAEICQVKEISLFTVKVGYTYLSKIQGASQGNEFNILSINYQDEVIMEISTDPENEENVRINIDNITSGSAKWMGCRQEIIKTAL